MRIVPITPPREQNLQDKAKLCSLLGFLFDIFVEFWAEISETRISLNMKRIRRSLNVFIIVKIDLKSKVF